MTRFEPGGALTVITGAGSGIGASTAHRFAQLGAIVVATDIDESAAQATAEVCRARGSEAHAYRCDVGDADDVAELAKRIEADLGPVSVLINNAGVGVGGEFLDGSLDDWIWLRSVNLDGVVHGCRSFGPGMIERGHGHVVNVASGAGHVPSKRLATYCASKAAVIMLSRCLRADWAGTGVGVSVICPGFINTPILGHTRLRGTAAGEQTRFARIFAHSRPPEDVADAILSAITHNREMVSVGIEARLAHYAHRVLPTGVTALMARI